MRHLLRLLAAAVLVLSTAAAYADLGDQLFELLPPDGGPGGGFGRCVAISGTITIVGAPHDDDNGDSAGAAYLFDTTTGQQIAKLLPDDGAAGDAFGYSVAISGATVIIGAIGDDEPYYASGSAYLFDISDPAKPVQIAKLLADDAWVGDYFGGSVAISDTTAIVGAWQNNDNEYDSGTAYLFDISDPANWTQIALLLPDDGVWNNWFGYTVAISGTSAIVGAPNDNDVCPENPHCNSGSAYLFDAATGQQLAKILPDDGAADDYFGGTVAISGATVIVGAPGDDENGYRSGSAYLFDITPSQQLAKLLPNDGAVDDRFGYSVAISGATVIIGAYRNGDNGAAYLFDATTGQQLAKLLSGDGTAGDWFGKVVGISGTAAIVSALGHNHNETASGAAYIFDVTDDSACPWDLDGDDNVGPYDLAFVLGFWGPNPGHPADLDGDGVVGPLDLALVLGNWGPCP